MSKLLVWTLALLIHGFWGFKNGWKTFGGKNSRKFEKAKLPFAKCWQLFTWHLHCIYNYLLCVSGDGNGTPLQYSCLESPIDGGAWKAAVHGVTEGRTLSLFTFTFHFHALEKEMATHSSVLAWRIPGTGEPGGLLSMGLHRVGHDWSDLAAAALC